MNDPILETRGVSKCTLASRRCVPSISPSMPAKFMP